jgi:hypothetical protein
LKTSGSKQNPHLNRIYEPSADDLVSIQRRVWDTIILTFRKSFGGFVTESHILQHDKSITSDILHKYFECRSTDEVITGKFMEIKPLYHTTRKQWVVLLPTWVKPTLIPFKNKIIQI